MKCYINKPLTVVDWLEGSYPNFFFTVDIRDVEKFTEHYASLLVRNLPILLSRLFLSIGFGTKPSMPAS